MQPGGYAYESYHNLLKRGYKPERLDAAEIVKRFPAWKAGRCVDGFFHARAGFAVSGRVVNTLVAYARQLGITVIEGQTAAALIIEGDKVRGVTSREGQTFKADHTIICAGAWTPWLLPELQPVMKTTGHPVYHLKPDNPALFTPPNFVVFTADIADSGWYGFPLHPTEGIVKIANHGIGLQLHPEHDERVVTAEDTASLRDFLNKTFPALVDAPIVYTRRCLYCDTLDEHLWIDNHPELANLTVAAGGSGHAFKMGPVLGKLIADAVEQRDNRWLPKFKWRTLAADTSGQEASRYHGQS
jgi:glycine/D-amino acid oxidase-like deaminating enzyme